MKFVIDIPEEMVYRFKHEGEQKHYDYHTVLKACINGTPPIPDSEIVKPYLEKLSKEIGEAYEEYDGYDPIALGRFEERVQDLIDDLLKGEAE